jgi:hypothetical protein
VAVAHAAGNPERLIAIGRAASQTAIGNGRLRIIVSDVVQT